MRKEKIILPEERLDNKWMRRRDGMSQTPMKNQQEGHQQWLKDKGWTEEQYQEKIAAFRQKWNQPDV
jgi:hypothetical protein